MCVNYKWKPEVVCMYSQSCCCFLQVYEPRPCCPCFLRMNRPQRANCVLRRLAPLRTSAAQTPPHCLAALQLSAPLCYLETESVTAHTTLLKLFAFLCVTKKIFNLKIKVQSVLMILFFSLLTRNSKSRSLMQKVMRGGGSQSLKIRQTRPVQVRHPLCLVRTPCPLESEVSLWGFRFLLVLFNNQELQSTV